MCERRQAFKDKKQIQSNLTGGGRLHELRPFIIIWPGKSERSDWFFFGQNSAIRTVSIETVIGCVFFLFSKAGKFKTSMARVPYNKLLSNLASSNRTGEYWPSVVFCKSLAALGPYCHGLGPIFPSTALALG